MRKLDYWVFGVENQLYDIREGFAEAFDIKDLFHDSENYWEYMFGFSKQFNAKVNLSRPYDLDIVPEVPIHIRLFFNQNKGPLSIEKIGEEFNTFFKLPVYYGSVSESRDSSYDYVFNSRKVFKRIDLSGLLKNQQEVDPHN